MSTGFWGLVQVVVLPALSEMLTVQVAPLLEPVVQEPPAVFMPLPPVSVELARVKVRVPLDCHAAGFGVQVPQVGAVLSNWYGLEHWVVILPAASLAVAQTALEPSMFIGKVTGFVTDVVGVRRNEYNEYVIYGRPSINDTLVKPKWLGLAGI